MLIGTGSVFYEREFSDNLSGQMGVAYLSYKFDNTKFSGFILTPEMRFYPKMNAIDGFYLAPYVRYQKFNLSMQDGTSEADYSNIGGGLTFGRQWITKSGFVMDLFFGGHYGSGKISGNSGGSDFNTSSFEGFRLRVGFAIGFAF